jgi:predicted adenylyl cyclase CyaB
VAANLEIKAFLHDKEAALAQAAAMGAHYEATLQQVDVYFQVPRGRLKLRTIDCRTAELIFYNRDESADQLRSRYERCRAADADQLRHILETAYGLRGVVEKKRTLWMYHQTRIHFDEVKHLGEFLEIEVPVGEEPHLAEQTMTYLLAGFRIDPGMYLRRSYIDMLTEKEPFSGKK